MANTKDDPLEELSQVGEVPGDSEGKEANVPSTVPEGPVLLSWTMKLVHPDAPSVGADADFLRFEGSPTDVERDLSLIRAKLKTLGWREVGSSPPPVGAPSGVSPAPSVAPPAVMVGTAVAAGAGAGGVVNEIVIGRIDVVTRPKDQRIEIQAWEPDKPYPLKKVVFGDMDEVNNIMAGSGYFVSGTPESFTPQPSERLFAQWVDSKNINPRNQRPYRELIGFRIETI